MRIGIVNDVVMAVEVLRRLVIQAGYQVAWVAYDGAQAVRQCQQDTPDLILMDLVMPVLDGVEATRAIMKSSPCAILIVTASVDRLSDKVFGALGAGALDAINTPVVGLSESGGAALRDKLGRLRHLIGPPPAAARPEQLSLAGGTLIAIGSSSGGPGALAEVLAGLPANLAAGIVIVQHIDPGFISGLCQWLSERTRLKVEVAGRRDRPGEGLVLVADTQGHLILTAAGRLDYSQEPASLIHRPSVDVFFESVARHWSGPAIGVILTGMGQDGAKGLLAMRNKGHHTMAQDQLTSAIFGMPRAAIQAGAAVEVLGLSEIAPALVRHTSRIQVRGTAI